MKSKYILFLLLLISYEVAGQIYNVEQRRLVTDTTGWAGKVSLSVSASKFTKSVFSLNASSHLQYKTDRDLYLFIVNYDIINADGENFDNRAYAHLRYNRKLNEWVRLEYFFQIQNNALTKVRERILNGIGARMKLSNFEKAKFYFGLAYMHEYEVLTEPVIKNNDHRISSYFTFTLLPEDGISLSNTTYIQPLIKDFNDYRVSNDTNLQFAISKNLHFSTIFTFLYDAKPPIEVPSLNYQIRNGIIYKF
ncbi:DUF481 domain-containing protein [Portibacter lacus]|uniref:DUF481 domain-containing protein n=1 Tax=Portibacter lacus TaxID=1099794 RepID=A0AA37SM02_9BACT|nr:DUF481 domain-containing protein [Portibacter lacus]GLR15489.1 hypothetical protein GCM10007940_01040 [Portibacter lacus]